MFRSLTTVSVAFLAVCLTMVGSTRPGQAADAVLSELYGQGVHSYFSGQYFESYELLSSAINQGSKDPRCFYFRGLCQMRLGRTEEAKQDFKGGATLELTGRDRIYPIGRSLQRIQGRQRLILEEHRQRARLDAHIESLNAQRARYDQRQSAEGQVLRDPNRRPEQTAEELVGPPPPADADTSDPFVDDEEPQPAPPRESAAPPAAAEPAPAEPATPAAPSDPAPADDDPFSTPPSDAPADDDPFATPPADAPAPDDPFDAPAPADDGDPFDPFN